MTGRLVRAVDGGRGSRAEAHVDACVGERDAVTAEFQSRSPGETLDLARAVGEAVTGPVVVALVGRLGAGKTLFARGLAAGLGFGGRVTSPSFTLVHTYRGRMTVHHLDVYRLDDPAEIEQLGFHEMLDDAVVVVEWADRVERFLPRERLDVAIEWVRGDGAGESTEARRIRMTARGPAHRELLRRVLAGGERG